MKIHVIALIAVASVSGSSLFAHDEKSCCAGSTTADMKQACDATFANLQLTGEQRASMRKLAAECEQGGCNQASMTKMEKGAKRVLSKQQFAAWKANCSAKVSKGQS